MFGWEVADAAALDALAAQLEAAGIEGRARLARARRRAAGEGPDRAQRPARQSAGDFSRRGGRVRAVRAGPRRSRASAPGRSGSAMSCSMSRASSRSISVMPFYRDLLGFRLTDYYSHPFEARFLHVNPRHHSLAFIKTGKNAVHHIMMEVFSFDDMGQGYDIALGRRPGGDDASAATHRISSRRSTASRRRASWSSTAGARARSIPTPGRRSSARKARACGATTASGSRPRTQAEARKLRLQNAASGHAPAGAGDGRQLPAHARRLPVVGQRDASVERVASMKRIVAWRVHSSPGLAQALGRRAPGPRR